MTTQAIGMAHPLSTGTSFAGGLAQAGEGDTTTMTAAAVACAAQGGRPLDRIKRAVSHACGFVGHFSNAANAVAGKLMVVARFCQTVLW